MIVCFDHDCGDLVGELQNQLELCSYSFPVIRHPKIHARLKRFSWTFYFWIQHIMWFSSAWDLRLGAAIGCQVFKKILFQNSPNYFILIFANTYWLRFPRYSDSVMRACPIETSSKPGMFCLKTGYYLNSNRGLHWYLNPSRLLKLLLRYRALAFDYLDRIDAQGFSVQFNPIGTCFLCSFDHV
jgi:hypothetical protein